jgi:hypothetical protein
VHDADALSIHDNFVAECGSCIELRGWGQASKITDNLIGAGPRGHSIYAEHHGGLLVTANNVFPRGSSSVRLHGATRSSVTANRLHSFYPGMVVLEAGSSENLIGANHLLRDHEPWTPFLDVGNGLDDGEGLVIVEGDGNSVIGNHISAAIERPRIRPVGSRPVMIRLASGSRNYIASNHVVATEAQASAGDSAFVAQVDALLSAAGTVSGDLDIVAVRIDPASVRNTILDSGTAAESDLDPAANAFRPTPIIGLPAP